jgi:hypothetical protein
MITFERHTDKGSGIDLYNLTDGTVTLKVDLDPWTVKTMQDVLDIVGIKYKEEEGK